MESEAVYEVNGREYTFIKIHMDGGYLRGYSTRRKKWAWLFDGYFQFDGEAIVVGKKVKQST